MAWSGLHKTSSPSSLPGIDPGNSGLLEIRRVDHYILKLDNLASLHWPSIAAQIEYNIALLTFKFLVLMQPAYLYGLLLVHWPARSLRSSKQETVLMFTVREHPSAASPVTRNSLPVERHACMSVTQCKAIGLRGVSVL